LKFPVYNPLNLLWSPAGKPAIILADRPVALCTNGQTKSRVTLGEI
jgi:hypothetical protein